MGRVAELGCILCRMKGLGHSPAEVHHVRAGQGHTRASHRDTIPLCPNHHRTSNVAIHVMGTRAWVRYHGVTEHELLAHTLNLLNCAP